MQSDVLGEDTGPEKVQIHEKGIAACARYDEDHIQVEVDDDGGGSNEEDHIQVVEDGIGNDNQVGTIILRLISRGKFSFTLF